MPLHPAGSPFAGLGSPPTARDAWSERLADAFADSARTTGFLALAEVAERACPGDPVILCQAAMAALLDHRPDKALVYLKRYAKRYVPARSHQLLSGLALGAQNKLIAARALLERHDLTTWRVAMSAFPGSWRATGWRPCKRRATRSLPRPSVSSAKPLPP